MRLRLCCLLLVTGGCFTDPNSEDPGGTSSSTGAAGSTSNAATTTSTTGSTTLGSSTVGGSDSSTTASTFGDESTSTGTPPERWSPTPFWLTRLDSGVDSIGDRIDALWLGEGAIWAAGSVARLGAPSQLSLHELGLKGLELETRVYVDEERFTNARAITPSQDGFWIAGAIDTQRGQTDRLLVEYTSADGFTAFDLWGAQPGRDIVMTAQSNGAQLFLGGSVSEGDEESVWTSRILGVATDWEEAGGPGLVSGSTVLADGDLVFAGSEGGEGWLRRVGTSGTENWVTALTEPGWTEVSARGVATNASGDVFAVGVAAVDGQGLNGWLARLGGTTGAVAWVVEADAAGLDDIVSSVAATDDAIFACGATATDAAGLDAWVGKFDLSGALVGEVSLDGGLGLDDQILACRVRGEELIVGGALYSDRGADRDGFVASLPVE